MHSPARRTSFPPPSFSHATPPRGKGATDNEPWDDASANKEQPPSQWAAAALPLHLREGACLAERCLSTAGADDRWAMIRRALAARGDGRAMARSEAAIAHLSAQARHLRSLLRLAPRCVAARSGDAAVEVSRVVLDAVRRALSAHSVTVVTPEALAQGSTSVCGWAAASLCFETGAATVGPAWPDAGEQEPHGASLASGTVLCAPSTSSAGAVRAVVRVERGATPPVDGPVLLPTSDLAAASAAGGGVQRLAVPVDRASRDALLAELAQRNRVVAIEGQQQQQQRSTADSGTARCAGALLGSSPRRGGGGGETAAVVSEVWAASDLAICEFGAALVQLASGGHSAGAQTAMTTTDIGGLEDAAGVYEAQRLMQAPQPLPLGLLLALDCDGEEHLQRMAAPPGKNEGGVTDMPAPLLRPPGHASLVLGPELCVRAAVVARRVLAGFGAEDGGHIAAAAAAERALHPTSLPLPLADGTPIPASARVARFPVHHASPLFVACLRVDRAAGHCELVYPYLRNAEATDSGPSGGGACVALALESYELSSCVVPACTRAAACLTHPLRTGASQGTPRRLHCLSAHHNALRCACRHAGAARTRRVAGRRARRAAVHTRSSRVLHPHLWACGPGGGTAGHCRAAGVQGGRALPPARGGSLGGVGRPRPCRPRPCQRRRRRAAGGQRRQACGGGATAGGGGAGAGGTVGGGGRHCARGREHPRE